MQPLQRQLGKIDDLRIDGKFLDSEGNCAPGQAVLHFLLHKCYRLVYKLQVSRFTVADSLMHVYKQLMTLDKCLKELLKWNMELEDADLLPYQMKLSMIDSLSKGFIFNFSKELMGSFWMMKEMFLKARLCFIIF